MAKVFIYGAREDRRNYWEALEACGGTAVVSLDTREAAGCGGLLLAGGGDIQPALYGQENQGSRNFEPERDEREFWLVREFLGAGKPILGICRGLQVLNAALGGGLVQDLPTAAAHAWEEPTGDKRHLVRAQPGSFLQELYGDEFPVNSAHHQGAGPVAPGLAVGALAEDGVCEALYSREKRVYAVQWHPERMMLSRARPDTVDGTPIFHFFLGLL